MDKILSDELIERFTVAHTSALQRSKKKSATECDLEYLEAIDETGEIFGIPGAKAFNWRKLSDHPDEAQQMLIWFGVGFFGTNDEFASLNHSDLPAAREILQEVRDKYGLSEQAVEKKAASAS